MDALLLRCLMWALIATTVVDQKPGGKPPPKPAGTPPSKNAPPPKLTPFLGKLEEARASAKERNVPIVVHLILEGEQASDDYRKKILGDPELVKAQGACLVIVSNNGQHAKASVEEVVDGAKQKRDVCAVFPMFAKCGQHQQTWAALYGELQESDGTMRCPQTAIIMPDGKVGERINTGVAPEPGEIVALIADALKTCGPGLTQEQLDLVRQKLELGKNLMASKSWADAWKSYAAVLAITQKGVYADEAQKEQPKALAGLQQEYERIVALLVPGTAVKGYQELMAFAPTTAGTPLEKDATTRLKRVENEKAIAAEIAAWKLSLEADKLLADARDAYEQKQEKKGEQLVRKLFGKRFATTPAAETARKLWPDIAADEASKNPPK